MQISEAESVVMDVLWAQHPLGADDVVAALSKQQDWQEASVANRNRYIHIKFFFMILS